MSKQTRLSSLIESLINILIGGGVALVSQLVIFPANGIHIDFHTNLKVTWWFTVVSVIRSYVIRRWFNARIHLAAQKVGASHERTAVNV